MPIRETNPERDSHLIALQALVWALAEPRRAERLLDTTGLNPQSLRDGAGDPAILAAALGFLEAHEPDLIACANELGISPALLVQAREALEQ
ncbi:DUF3572 domain-containing protein [Sphingomonas sp. 37zxx]|uniref:DUF3572 domain-containing protein n=1 Tax=Sphingomonas sp. 37zxx TaxID=1550073 RepID=UPI0006900D53|nr:DUF3572 domain-containing protein [Sphingomonas sp. 37zxx]